VLSAQPLPLPLAVVLVGVLIASVTDIWKFKVHNALTLPLLVSGLVYHTVFHPGCSDGWAGLSNSVLGMLFGFACLLIFFIMGGMGAGDVKLMAGVGAWLGMPLTLHVFIASSLAAGAYAVVLLTIGHNLRETWTNLQILWIRLAMVGRHLGGDNRIESEVRRADRRRLIPFAAMMAIGLIIVLIRTRLK
jgi:prepilin peptidase CpaA